MNDLKKLIVSLVAGSCFIFAANAFADTNEVTIKFYPDAQTNAKTNPVSLSFSGNLYKDKPLLEQGKPRSLKLSAAETALAKFLDVNAKGTPDEVLEVWNPPERESIKAMVAKPDLFARNKAINANISETRMVARINYGVFTLFFVEHKWMTSDYKVRLYAFTEKDSQYFATNLLTSDFFYSRIASTLEQYFDRSRIKN